MSFAAPWVLSALLLLPGLWWLLRASPPAVREQLFPAIALLGGLAVEQQTPARTPWWLLALRLAAAAAVIVGLAGPVRPVAHAGFGAAGPLLLVVDDGWASAADWPARLGAAEGAARSGGTGRATRATAGDGAGCRRHAATARADADGPRPCGRCWPWPNRWRGRWIAPPPPGRCEAPRPAPVAYLDDGVNTPDRADFADHLASIGPVEDLRAASPPALLLGVAAAGDRLVARLRGLPASAARRFAVLGRADDDTVLARQVITLAAGADSAETAFTLPPELRNRLGRFTLVSQASVNQAGASEAGAAVASAGRRRLAR